MEIKDTKGNVEVWLLVRFSRLCADRNCSRCGGNDSYSAIFLLLNALLLAAAIVLQWSSQFSIRYGKQRGEYNYDTDVKTLPEGPD